MELIYIWIGENEDFIFKNQGFCFNGKYNIEFLENTLTLKENSVYLENFYQTEYSKNDLKEPLSKFKRDIIEEFINPKLNNCKDYAPLPEIGKAQKR